MSDVWVMVRLKRATEARLREIELSLRRAYEAGQIELELDQQGRVSVNQIVEVLVDRYCGHKERSRRSARGRKQKSVERRLAEVARKLGVEVQPE